MLQRLRDRVARKDPLAALSHQEKQILDLIGEGLTNRQIGERMFLAEKTVKNYVSNHGAESTTVATTPWQGRRSIGDGTDGEERPAGERPWSLPEPGVGDHHEGMRFDAYGLEILDRGQCLALLGSVTLGRVVFTDRALPAIQPVNFRLDGEDIVIRTLTGSKLSVAIRGTIVAFEADEFDPLSHTGWSVTLIGQARLVNEPGEIARLSALGLRPWTPGPCNGFIRISGKDLAGRWIRELSAGPGDLVA